MLICQSIYRKPRNFSRYCTRFICQTMANKRRFFLSASGKAFLYTAVRNKALNELEHSKVVYEYAQNVIEKKKDSFFHDAIVEEETYRIVSEAINKLPDQMKAIMQLSLEGKKNAEIADRLNISTETVHTLKKIAYKKLRENLKDYYYFLLFFI